jgi:hypothetical protein
MTSTDVLAQTSARGATRCPDCTDGLGQPRPVPPGSWRDRIHRNPNLARVWRVGVFLAGLWVWSTEFEWARRFFAVFRRKARDAWAHARQHPVSSIVITVGGLAAAAVAVWAVGHFQLVDRAREALGA